ETEPLSSSLPKDTAYRLMTALAEQIQEHFKASGSGRSYGRRPASSRFRNLDAARAFEAGLNAVEQFEYAAALDAFRRGASLDDQHAMTKAWMSRVLLVMNRTKEALASAKLANQLLTPDMPRADSLFAAGVLAESQTDWTAAERLYRELSTLRADEAGGRL